MKINKVILSSTNDDFLDFYPIVSKAWRNLDIEPILFLINGDTKEDPSIINLDFSSEVIDNIFLSQNVRLLATCLYPDDVSILSDIDMMPLSKEYFQGNISKYSDDQFINMRKNVIKENMYPICYSVAHGKTWREIFKVDSIDSMKTLISDWYHNEFQIDRSWYFDQMKLHESVKNFILNKQNRFVELDDSVTKFCRLNRTNLKWRFKNFYDENKQYTDFHMPRPYKKYEKIIHKVYEKTYSDDYK